MWLVKYERTTLYINNQIVNDLRSCIGYFEIFCGLLTVALVLILFNRLYSFHAFRACRDVRLILVNYVVVLQP